jgi:hypothetical protein
MDYILRCTRILMKKALYGLFELAFGTITYNGCIDFITSSR